MAKAKMIPADDANDEIQTGAESGESRAAPKQPKGMTARYVGDPNDDENTPQRRSITFAGRAFPLDKDVNVDDLGEVEKAKLIGHTHFITNRDEPGARERIAKKVKRAQDAAKEARSQRLKAEQKADSFAEQIESQD